MNVNLGDIVFADIEEAVLEAPGITSGGDQVGGLMEIAAGINEVSGQDRGNREDEQRSKR